jgi:hypothetical protein
MLIYQVVILQSNKKDMSVILATVIMVCNGHFSSTVDLGGIFEHLPT